MAVHILTDYFLTSYGLTDYRNEYVMKLILRNRKTFLLSIFHYIAFLSRIKKSIIVYLIKIIAFKKLCGSN